MEIWAYTGYANADDKHVVALADVQAPNVWTPSQEAARCAE